MGTGKVYRAIGLMSGTSLDGVDAALVETDGRDFVRPVGFYSRPYDAETRAKIRAFFGKKSATPEIETLIADKHIEAVRALLAQEKVATEDMNVIGFHGQTIYHNPAQKITVQIGDAGKIAREIGVQVVADFRSADVKAGGQGAPLLPLYHAARVKVAGLKLPVVVLNIGGISNVTWIGKDNQVLAFDTGPGNALIDDWVKRYTGKNFDDDGAFAKSGKLNQKVLKEFLKQPYFEKMPPKSLDRDEWDLSGIQNLSPEDGAATLTVITAEAIRRGAEHFSSAPRQWLVAGGGRHNRFLMDYLRILLGAPVNPVENQGWNGDAMEAEGFAYLAVRSLLAEPLSLPETTGVPRPLTGGVLYKP